MALPANCFYCQGEAKTAPFVDGDGIGHVAVCNRGSCAEHVEMVARKQREARGLHDLQGETARNEALRADEDGRVAPHE